jgi:hypothetical protein
VAQRKRQGAKQLEEAAMRAAVSMRNQEVGRASTIDTIAEQGIPAPVDIEQGGAADPSPPPTSAAARRSWRFLFWRRR